MELGLNVSDARYCPHCWHELPPTGHERQCDHCESECYVSETGDIIERARIVRERFWAMTYCPLAALVSPNGDYDQPMENAAGDILIPRKRV